MDGLAQWLTAGSLWGAWVSLFYLAIAKKIVFFAHFLKVLVKGDVDPGPPGQVLDLPVPHASACKSVLRRYSSII
ncbi:MAG: hypothetical protein L0Y73_03425 [Candidatus Aminicenantes bacterium]|nr:hypothetical protein [Candidatus Aminicenantes bacterium]